MPILRALGDALFQIVNVTELVSRKEIHIEQSTSYYVSFLQYYVQF